MRGLVVLVVLLAAGGADSKGGRKAKKDPAERCAVLGHAAVQDGPPAARYGRIVAHAACLREQQDTVGMAAALSRVAGDADLKHALPEAATDACNQVAELAMQGHIGWREAERVFR